MQVLSGLERADGEDVVAVRGGPARAELVARGERDDADALLRHVQQLDELAFRELGDRDHAGGRPHHPRDEQAAVDARPPVEGLRKAQDREVEDRDDERDGRARRCAEGRTVQDVDSRAVRAAREAERIPRRIPHRRPDAARPAEGQLHQLDPPVQARQQLLQVARRSRARERERGDVDPDPHRFECFR